MLVAKALVALLLATLLIAPATIALAQPLGAAVEYGLVLFEGEAALKKSGTTVQELTLQYALLPDDLNKLLNTYDSDIYYVVVNTGAVDKYADQNPLIRVLISNGTNTLFTATWQDVLPNSTLEFVIPRWALEKASAGNSPLLVVAMYNYNTDTASGGVDSLVYVVVNKVVLAPPEDAIPQETTTAQEDLGAGYETLSVKSTALVAAVTAVLAFTAAYFIMRR